ncbi:hypothetical protein GE09DRAFT_963282 [Coniochaeta sp. 2T2.1]|nr:hypothetical protein GE09DRAFT_963282 [Coniochaeta sp. 2T2.1]
MRPELLQADASPSPSPASQAEDAPRKRKRSRMSTACSACRGRKSKCDGRRPACGYCRTRGFECQYESTLRAPTSRVEVELAAINQRLDHITSLLPPAEERPSPSSTNGHRAYSHADHAQANVGHHVLTSQDFTSQEMSPFQLLGSECIMEILGLGRGFARELLKLERDASAAAVGLPGRGPMVRMMQQQQALEALAAFSTYIHVWFPVLRPGFSDRYFRVISGPLLPCPESCLVLLVAAVGSVARQDPLLGHDNNMNNNNRMVYEDYLDVAKASLPTVLVDGSIESVQCLVLLSIYHCCLSKPYQAYEYAMVASFKVQNLLKHLSTRLDDSTGGDGELHEQHEHAKRAYWAVLLIESELRVQFDVVESGIWDHDDRITLPDSRRTWEFNVELGSPQSTTNSCTSPTSHASAMPDHNTSNRAHSYFLAEISMRRMLHRCNTAIRRTSPQGAIVYAPHIASELELQLDEWYYVLPDAVRFQLDVDFDLPHSAFSPPVDPLASFLRVQYFCCKISIYWPAVYQSIQDGSAGTTPETLRHCELFFGAYIRVMPSMLTSIRDCIVNRWTLYASIFMTSMAVILAAQTPCLRAGCAVDWDRLAVCLRSTRTVDTRIVQASPSLSLLDSALARRLAEVQSLLEPV